MEYFPHDTNALNDEKIEALTSNFGASGYAFYFILCERIYRTENFELDISDPETIKVLERKTFSDAETFQKLIRYSLRIGLFDEQKYDKDHVLTSNGIKERSKIVLEKREKMRNKYQNRVSDAETGEETPVSDEFLPLKESKVKKSKEELPTHWIQKLISERLLQVSRLKTQLTIKNCLDLENSFPAAKIRKILWSMENYKKLNTNYVSVYLTALQWLEREGVPRKRTELESCDFCGEMVSSLKTHTDICNKNPKNRTPKAEEMPKDIQDSIAKLVESKRMK